MLRLFLAILAMAPLVGEGAPPNIVLILCDDLGYSDVGFNGADDIRTPALDRLAADGAICTDAYVPHPFCGPSRVGIMTGRYPHALGAPFNLPRTGEAADDYGPLGVEPSETFISKMLQNAGYFTGAIGKWHLGDEPQQHPNKRGFNEYFGFLGGGHKYFPTEYKRLYKRAKESGAKHIWDYLTPLEHNGKEIDEQEYLTDALSREAVRFVQKAATKEEPFFLYVAYNAPHVPLEAKEEDLAQFGEIEDDDRRRYAAMVYAVDRGVEQITEAIEDTGQLSNTLIVFLSDNGGNVYHGATNRPLRGSKGDTHEGGFRVPMFMHWPDRIPGGTRFTHPISALDFYPTFARLAGAELPAGKMLDGVDAWEGFVNGSDPHANNTIFAMRHRNGFSDVAARRGKWKACKAYNEPWRLHDLSQDRAEEVDLSANHPKLLNALVLEAEQWSRDHPQPRWFHDLATREDWEQREMPNHESTFSVGN
ncbi:Arylsulfatase [Planctomycetes bacterium MalM25]|nr:Arylsulfatase [Planctomycetes bacterium MalM25]